MRAPSWIEKDMSVVVDDVVVRFPSETDDLSAVPPHRRRAARLARMIGRPYRMDIEAIRGVSFHVYEGEHVGLVGANGSGKSTLLRVIAGVINPDRGSVLASGSPTLLGVSAALLPHLTGAKNVRLGLLALGYTPEQAKEAASAVAELADLGDAINRPMNTYSSGMAARLRFAIAVATDPDILLIDEALGTGDASFTERAREALDGLRERAGTIFLVSHAAQTIEEMCSRAIWLHEGEIVTDGPADVVALHYRNWAWARAHGDNEKAQRLFIQAKER
ncbi:ATP-binding cassette domain-containing protein [Epidermidibacterium keratini]|uniref:ATP-binding cassette domain-containing protein n=1 Tax=Epidermidibacterium keratini TaxID=1891644 RepID=A0A7L4YQZ5_9ACTN|nr:ATP-binding cassette domain-containing protein [Epidermidibacterium keratini]QHC01478.1 ATP-binding cassette domain-containing protein [Epidermidibacterium keratini]